MTHAQGQSSVEADLAHARGEKTSADSAAYKQAGHISNHSKFLNKVIKGSKNIHLLKVHITSGVNCLDLSQRKALEQGTETAFLVGRGENFKQQISLQSSITPSVRSTGKMGVAGQRLPGGMFSDKVLEVTQQILTG